MSSRRCLARPRRARSASGGAARHERARVAAEKAQWRADVVKTERFVPAWANRRPGPAFRAWRDNARRRVSDRRRALAFVTRVQAHVGDRSWSTWRFNARECKAQRARARRARRRPRPRDALASAFYAWSRRTSDEKFCVCKSSSPSGFYSRRRTGPSFARSRRGASAPSTSASRRRRFSAPFTVCRAKTPRVCFTIGWTRRRRRERRVVARRRRRERGRRR